MSLKKEFLEKKSSYKVHLNFRIDWHKLSKSKKEDISNLFLDVIRLENEGLTLMWNYEDSIPKEIFFEKKIGKEKYTVQMHEVGICVMKGGFLHEKPIFYLEYKLIIDYWIYLVLLDSENPKGSKEEFEEFVKKQYGKEHWLFKLKKYEFNSDYLSGDTSEYRNALASKILNENFIEFEYLPEVKGDFYSFSIVDIRLSDNAL